MKKFNNFLLESIDEKKWNEIEDLIFELVSDENFKQPTYLGFINIDPTSMLSVHNTDIYLHIVNLFNQNNKRLFEILLKNDLFVEESPYEDELIFTEISFYYKYMTNYMKVILEKMFPGFNDKIKISQKTKEFNI